MKRLVLLLVLAIPAHAVQGQTTVTLGCAAANLLLAQLVGDQIYKAEGARFRKFANENDLAQIVLDWATKIETGEMTVADLKAFSTQCYDIVAK